MTLVRSGTSVRTVTLDVRLASVSVSPAMLSIKADVVRRSYTSLCEIFITEMAVVDVDGGGGDARTLWW